MTYTLLNTPLGDATFDITQLISTIRWGGDINQAARRLEVELAYGLDAYLPKYKVPLGSLLTLKSDTGEIIRGVCFDTQRSTDGGYRVISYDHMIYLLKNKQTYIFRNMSPEAIIIKICTDFSIPVGSVASTGIVLPKLIVRQDSCTLYDICLMALTEAMKRTGKKYVLKMKEGKLQVIEKAKQTVRWVITEGQNLITANIDGSIEDMRNRIVILGDKDQVLAKVENADLIGKYGILQELKKEGNIKSGEAQTIAKNMLRDLGKISWTASTQCLGIDDVEAGTAIEMQETLTGLTGTFYVETDDHTIQNGEHTMNLKLSWTDEVAKQEAPIDEQA